MLSQIQKRRAGRGLGSTLRFRDAAFLLYPPTRLPAYPLTHLPHRYPATKLSRPPDPPALHDPLDRIEVVDVLQRVLVQQHEIGVVAGFDGAEPAAGLTADCPGSVTGGRQQRRRGVRAIESTSSRSSPSSEARSMAGP